MLCGCLWRCRGWCWLCVHRMLTFVLFFSIYSNPSFHMHFYQCFFMLPLAAPCRTESKWRSCADRMLVSLKNSKTQIVSVVALAKLSRRQVSPEGTGKGIQTLPPINLILCRRPCPPNKILKNVCISFVKQNLKKGGRFLCCSILLESI